MALLDFIKNRNAQQQSTENTQANPETAKQMYTRQTAEEKAAERPITPEIKAQADRATAAMEKATQHQHSQSAPSPEGSSTNTAHLQKQNQQDKTQSALSPTDDAKGKTATQEKPPAQEKTTERPQTIARRPPSWER